MGGLLELALVHAPPGVTTPASPHVGLLYVVVVRLLLLMELLTPGQTVQHRLRHGDRRLRDGVTSAADAIRRVYMYVVST